MMHGSACTIRIIIIHCTGVVGAAMCSTSNIVNNNVHHRTSATIGAFKATTAVPRAAVRAAAVVVQIASSSAEAEMWAKILVAIIVLGVMMTVLPTGAIGIITPRGSRTAAMTAGCRQCDHRITKQVKCDHRALYMTFATTVRQSS